MKKTALITDFVCIATAGKTADGRTISANDLMEMAESYDPETYTAQIWHEHYRSMFANFGQVRELKVEEVEGKIKLFARLAPTLAMIEYNKEGIGLFTSIEITPNFADTGKAYLTGLAITNSPASLGTTQLNFSKKSESVYFTPAEKIEFSLNAEEDDFSLFKKFFNLGKRLFSEKTHPEQELPSTQYNNNNKEQSMDEKQFNQLLEALNGLSTKIDQHFSLKPAIEAEKTVEKADESEPQKYATVEQLDEIKSVMTELSQKFNQLLQPVTDIPTGEPVKSEKFNVGAM